MNTALWASAASPSEKNPQVTVGGTRTNMEMMMVKPNLPLA
jgi:hypothetical protein